MPPDFDAADGNDQLLAVIRSLIERQLYRVTQHAQQEMTEENILLDDIIQAIRTGKLIENYPDHKRGPCCLILGYSPAGRPLHLVATTSLPLVIVITAYEPKSPKWITPETRRRLQ